MSFLRTVLLLFAAPSLMFSQTSQASLVVSVVDPQDKGVGAVDLVLTNLDSGWTWERKIPEGGGYRFDGIPPGPYSIRLKKDGFRTYEYANLRLLAGRTTAHTARLALGERTETMRVDDLGPALQTQEATRSFVLDQRQITALPVASLNPTDLAVTLPGVLENSPLTNGLVLRGPSFSTNGARPRSSNHLLDGTENNYSVFTGQATETKLRDAYREVTVLTGQQPAEYGRSGGAILNIVTRSGGNQYHGSVYNVLTPSVLRSLSNGQKTTLGLSEVPYSLRNQPGGSLGGPLIKDKLSFFGTFQADLLRTQEGTASALVPTDAAVRALRNLFPAGSSRNFDTYMALLGDLRGTSLPRPIALGGDRAPVDFAIGTRTGLRTPQDLYEGLGRVDWRPTGVDTVTVRYFASSFGAQAPTSAFQGFDTISSRRGHNAYVAHNRELGSRSLNELRLAYFRFEDRSDLQQGDLVATLPRFTIAGAGGGGLFSVYPIDRMLNNYQIQDTLTATVGNHTLRAGFDLVLQRTRVTSFVNTLGSLAFSAGGGFPALGNFLDGFSGTQGIYLNRTAGQRFLYPERNQQAYFVHDHWRIGSTLSLELGLRYESYGSPWNGIRFPAFGGLLAPADAVVRQEADRNNFAPRVGFAWAPRASAGVPVWLRGFVFRGGYSINYDAFFDNFMINTASAAPNAIGVTQLGATFGGRGVPNAFLAAPPAEVPAVLNPLTAVTTIDPRLRNPLTHQTSIGLQRSIANTWLWEASYVASRGQRLFLSEPANPGVNGVRINPARGPITLRTNGGDSNYHSLQTRLDRSLQRSLFLRVSYTWSKAIDNVNSDAFLTTGGNAQGSSPFDRRADRSLASFDAPHRLVLAAVYRVPSSRVAWLRQLFGGVEVSGLWRIQSGGVENPYVDGFDLNRDLNAFNDRPSISNRNAPRTSVAIARSVAGLSGPGYVDANGQAIEPGNAYYLVDPAVRTGIAGRNTLRSERLNVVDVSLIKSISLPKEGHRFEVRVDFFNALNHPNFLWPNPDGLSPSNGNVLSPNFNRPRLNDGGSRSGRFQLSYQF